MSNKLREMLIWTLTIVICCALFGAAYGYFTLPMHVFAR
jgi:hypothetical protein